MRRPRDRGAAVDPWAPAVGEDPDRRALPRRCPAPRHPSARRRADDPGVSIGTLLRIRRALEERL